MAYTAEEWGVAKAFYEEGLSLAQITDRPEVAIKDRTGISKRAKAEGWVKGKNSTILSREIAVKQEVAQLSEQKSTLNSTELEIHNTLVDEKTRDLIFFRSASLIIAQKAVDKVQTEDCTMKDLRDAQEVIGKGKENIYDKAPATSFTVDNSTKTQINLRALSTAQLLAMINAQP